ncbi:peptidoglycan-binding protein [Streptomyces griseofuscus]|uniref:peptidoglycan-binding protein n=1 Tax=Streptomyces griseofuscus TaxID=146922 RepID=UPI003804A838
MGQLRRLKDHSGLTLMSLQAKTPFSSSAWDWYLNGEVLPPAAAVEALAKIVGTDASPLLALRDAASAAAERTGQAAAEAAPPAASKSAEAETEATAPRIYIAALSLTAGVLLLSAVVSLVLVVDTPHPGAGSAQPSVSRVGRYVCAYTRRGDLLFGGNSTTSSRLVMLNSTGPDVAEVQCLLLRHRLSPGDVDGYFGSRTQEQVKQLQRQDHVPADGIVGPETWGLLRHVEWHSDGDHARG